MLFVTKFELIRKQIMFERKLAALEFYSPNNFNYEGKLAIYLKFFKLLKLSTSFVFKRWERISKLHNMVGKSKDSLI